MATYIQFPDRCVSYDTFMDDLSSRIVRKMQRAESDPKTVDRLTPSSGAPTSTAGAERDVCSPASVRGKWNTAWQTSDCSNRYNRTISNAKKIMDYAIYKTTDGKAAHVVHRFTQDACNHRAKAAAQAKLNDMWLRLLQRPALHKNATGAKDEFSYDHISSVNTSERIRFYIAQLKENK